MNKKNISSTAFFHQIPSSTMAHADGTIFLFEQRFCRNSNNLRPIHNRSSFPVHIVRITWRVKEWSVETEIYDPSVLLKCDKRKKKNSDPETSRRFVKTNKSPIQLIWDVSNRTGHIMWDKLNDTNQTWSWVVTKVLRFKKKENSSICKNK